MTGVFKLNDFAFSNNTNCKIFFFAKRRFNVNFGSITIFLFCLVSLHSAPYLSVAKLQVENLTTVLYDRHKLCQSIGLATAQLPLLACLLGNDVVSEVEMQHIRDEAMAIYRCLEFYF